MNPPGPDEVAVLALADIAPAWRLWGFGRFVFARFGLRRVPGLRFFKVLGSGHEGGFGLRPSGSRQGLFCVFDGEPAADRFLASGLIAAYRQRSLEFLSVKLRTYNCRGAWAGRPLSVRAERPADGRIATLTRASIRPGVARQFWRRAPPAEASLQGASGCLLAVGLGEAPLLRQATFSVWDSEASMEGYARSGAHLDAIRAAYGSGYFSESMFARFVPSALSGVWKGRCYG